MRKSPCQERLPKCKDRFVEPKRAQEGSFSHRSIGAPFGEIELLHTILQSPTANLWDSVVAVCGPRDLACHKGACIEQGEQMAAPLCV